MKKTNKGNSDSKKNLWDSISSILACKLGPLLTPNRSKTVVYLALCLLTIPIYLNLPTNISKFRKIEKEDAYELVPPSELARYLDLGRPIVLSLLTISAAEIFLLAFDFLMKKATVRQFRKFFGIEQDNKVVLVMSRFTFDDMVDSEVLSRAEAALNSNRPRIDALAAFADVQAAMIITALFQSELGVVPQIISDNELLPIGRMDATIVSIGLYLNKFTDKVLDEYANKRVGLRPRQIDDQNLNGAILVAQPGKDVTKNAQPYEYSDRTFIQDEDYALILRVQVSDPGTNTSATRFVCGGITAEGTVQAAQYLADNWKRFSKEKGTVSKLFVEVARVSRSNHTKPCRVTGLADV